MNPAPDRTYPAPPAPRLGTRFADECTVDHAKLESDPGNAVVFKIAYHQRRAADAQSISDLELAVEALGEKSGRT